ncbi:MAG: oligosaccharide flippase family protein [Proteobacteria bacterium]|nr:oligosaccharide flippase family protein [Pseudomonadota bacterium]
MQTLYVLAANIFTLAVGLPLQIYVSRILGAEGLGIYSLLDGSVATIVGLIAFGLPQTAVRFIPEYLERREYSNIRRLVGGGLLISLSVGIAAYLVVLLLLDPLGRWWPSIAGHKGAVAVICLAIPLSLASFFQQQALRGLQEVRHLLIGSSFIALVVKASLTVIGFSIGLRLLGYIWATVIASLSATLWMAYGLWREFALLPRTQNGAGGSLVPVWRRYAMVCYAAALLSAVTGSLDRFVLGIFISSSAVGVLMVVRQLQQLPVVFNQMFLMVGAPMLSAAQSRNDSVERQSLYALMTDWIVRASLPLMLFLMLFARPLLSLFGPVFADQGVVPLWIFVAAQFFNLASGPCGAVTMMCGLERLALRLDILSALLLTVLVVTLIPKFGLLGAATASMAANIFINTAIVILLRRRLGMNWWNRRFLGWGLPTIATIAVGFAVLATKFALGAFTLTVTLAIMYAVFLAASLLQGLHEDDLDLLRHIRSGVFNLNAEN